MTMVNRQPRYRQLAQTLMTEIKRGRYPVGSLLPTEYELCEQFGASRFTIREAMKQLVQMGLIDRSAGVGTRVRAADSQSLYRQQMQELSDLYQYTSDTHFLVEKVGRVVVDAKLAELLRANEGQRWLRAEGIRRIGKTAPPICFTELFIHPAFSTIDLARRMKTPVYTLIEQQFGEQIEEVQQDIRAVLLSAAMAARLESKPRSPALLITRRYLNHRGETVEFAISTHPAERFEYSQSFRRSWAAR